MSKNLHLVHASVTLPVIQYLKWLQAPVIELMEQAQFPLSVLEKVDQNVPTLPWWHLMQLAYEYTGDKALGFHIDEQQQLKVIGKILEQIKSTSHSVYDALVNLNILKANVSSHGTFEIKRQEKGAWFLRSTSDYDPDIGEVPMEQLVLANMLRLVQFFSKATWTPLMITIVQQDTDKVFRNKFPKAMISDKNIFTGFFIPNHILGKLNPKLKTHAEKFNSPGILPQTFAECLYQALFPYRRVKLPELSEVSDKLGLSRRQIQRRLEKEGTHYKEVIQTIRYDVAREMLGIPDYLVIDIAIALGYSSSGHFVRAFKQWSGVTPSQYRKHQLDR